MNKLQAELAELERLQEQLDSSTRKAKWAMVLAVVGGLLQLLGLVLRLYGY